jgi:hypothetical protein
VACVNKRVRAALANPGQPHTLDEARAIVRGWRCAKQGTKQNIPRASAFARQRPKTDKL